MATKEAIQKFKAGRYASQEFTPRQKTARAKWDRARQQRLDIHSALKIIPFVSTRQELHDRLDRRLNAIERMEASAKALFPDVEESYTIASMSIDL